MMSKKDVTITVCKRLIDLVKGDGENGVDIEELKRAYLVLGSYVIDIIQDEMLG